jgi:taurine dioxygenase
MPTLTPTSFAITPTNAALGAVVSGLDASQPVAPDIILQLKQALQDYHVLIFHNQTLTDAQLLEFSTYFGDVFFPPADIPVLGSKPAELPPAVVTIANAAPELSENLLENYELLPHSDHQWTPRPSSGSLLYATEVPEQGGNTHWFNLAQAYAELDDGTKAQIADLQLITHNPWLNHYRTSPTYRSAPTSAPPPPVYAHPLVRTHPASGKKILYLNCSYEVELVGVDAEVGAALIAKLRQHINQPRFAYEHQWAVGDIVYWDNQITLHYRPAFDPQARRVMKRVSLTGSRPF